MQGGQQPPDRANRGRSWFRPDVQAGKAAHMGGSLCGVGPRVGPPLHEVRGPTDLFLLSPLQWLSHTRSSPLAGCSDFGGKDDEGGIGSFYAIQEMSPRAAGFAEGLTLRAPDQLSFLGRPGALCPVSVFAVSLALRHTWSHCSGVLCPCPSSQHLPHGTSFPSRWALCLGQGGVPSTLVPAVPHHSVGRGHAGTPCISFGLTQPGAGWAPQYRGPGCGPLSRCCPATQLLAWPGRSHGARPWSVFVGKHHTGPLQAPS